MNLRCQHEAYIQLEEVARDRKHSILISGSPGCGKSRFARFYSNLLGISDYIQIESKVDALRSAIDTCYSFNKDIVICVENLDSGVAGASYALLKFLEEPPIHVYLVITCTNLSGIPDTILSRCITINIDPPTRQDIDTYAKSQYESTYEIFQPILPSLKSLNDVDFVSKYDKAKIQYILDLKSLIYAKSPINTIVWNLSHFSDNSELPIELAMNYILHVCNDTRIVKNCISCIRDLNLSRIPKHVILSRFVLECKYGD